MPKPSITAKASDFERGFFCAVAVLLRESGVATTDVRNLFASGGGVLGAAQADPEDRALFIEHGLMPE